MHYIRQTVTAILLIVLLASGSAAGASGLHDPLAAQADHESIAAAVVDEAASCHASEGHDGHCSALRPSTAVDLAAVSGESLRVAAVTDTLAPSLTGPYRPPRA